jgi:hypothetical protein
MQSFLEWLEESTKVKLHEVSEAELEAARQAVIKARQRIEKAANVGYGKSRYSHISDMNKHDDRMKKLNAKWEEAGKKYRELKRQFDAQHRQ